MATEPKRTTRRRRPAKKDAAPKATDMPVAKADEPVAEPAPAPAPRMAIPEGQRKPMDFTRMPPTGVTADTTRPVPEGMTRYLVKLACGGPDGHTYIKGEVIDLYDSEARYFNKHGAIGLYLTGDDVAPDVLPKPVRIKRRDASKFKGAPTPLGDHQMLEVDETL